MNNHFAQRVQERIGNVDPNTLYRALQWAIRNDRDDLVRFVARADKKGRRFFAFNVPDGRRFVALVDTESMVPITVLPPHGVAGRQGKAPLKLESVT